MTTRLPWLPIIFPEEDLSEPSELVEGVMCRCALVYGRCHSCDRIRNNGILHERRCTCCPKCWNRADKCVCCRHCAEPLNVCVCDKRMEEIWGVHPRECVECEDAIITQLEYVEVEPVIHRGTPCPLCCPYCTMLKSECRCCKKCRTTPCICCIDCGNVRIKCKCYSVKFLSHFLKHALVYKEIVQYLPDDCFLKNPDEDDE